MGGGVGGHVVSGVGRVGGVRVDVNEELKFLGKFKKNLLFWGGVRGGLGQERGGGVGRVLGVRVDVNEELKFLGKFTKKKNSGRGGGGGSGGAQGGGGGRAVGGVRLDMNTMLGVGVMWGMWDVNQE